MIMLVYLTVIYFTEVDFRVRSPNQTILIEQESGYNLYIFRRNKL